MPRFSVKSTRPPELRQQGPGNSLRERQGITHNMMPTKQAETFHTSPPLFRVLTRDHLGSDSYRLRDGYVEFCPEGYEKWRCLTESDVRLHFVLDTPVGRWLGSLTSGAEVARELAD